MNIAPAAEASADLETMAMLNGRFCQVRELYAALIHRTSSPAVDQWPVNNGRSDVRVCGGEFKKEVINGTLW